MSANVHVFKQDHIIYSKDSTVSHEKVFAVV